MKYLFMSIMAALAIVSASHAQQPPAPLDLGTPRGAFCVELNTEMGTCLVNWALAQKPVGKLVRYNKSPTTACFIYLPGSTDKTTKAVPGWTSNPIAGFTLLQVNDATSEGKGAPWTIYTPNPPTPPFTPTSSNTINFTNAASCHDAQSALSPLN